MSENSLRFDVSRVDEVIQAIAGSNAQSFAQLDHDIYRCLMRESLKESVTVKLLGDAFSYQVRLNWNSAGFRASLSPAHAGQDSWPAKLPGVEAAVQETWSYLHSQVAHEPAKARLADLLLSVGVKPSIDWARAAIIEGQVAFERRAWNQDERYLLAIRALSICNQFRQDKLRLSLLAVIADELELSLGTTDWMTRPFLNLARAFKVAIQNFDLDAVLGTRWKSIYERTWAALQGVVIDDYIAEDLVALAVSPTDRLEIQRRHITYRIELGDSSKEGFRQMHHYEAAATLAKKYELHDAHQEAIRLLQRSSASTSTEWSKIGSTINVPRGVIERDLRTLTSVDNWQSPLEAILNFRAPTGSLQSNIESARRLAATSPLRHLITNVTMGVHGLPEKTRTTQEAAVAADLLMIETLSAQSQAQIMGMALDRLKGNFPNLSGEQVTVYICDKYRSSSKLTARLGVALESFWEGNYEAAGWHCLFNIEGAAREILLLLDEPLYRVQVGESRGKFPSLDFYIEALEKRGFDPNWSRTIKSVLLADGMNLRNLAAHGYDVSIGRTEAVLLIRIFGALCVSAPETSGEMPLHFWQGTSGRSFRGKIPLAASTHRLRAAAINDALSPSKKDKLKTHELGPRKRMRFSKQATKPSVRVPRHLRLGRTVL